MCVCMTGSTRGETRIRPATAFLSELFQRSLFTKKKKKEKNGETEEENVKAEGVLFHTHTQKADNGTQKKAKKGVCTRETQCLKKS